MDFEEKLTQTLILYENSLNLKLKFYDFINRDHIDLDAISSVSDVLLNQREEIRTNILQLANVNTNTPLFNFLAEGFVDNLSFMES